MMRYRPATSRPGRNRPSFSRYSAELESREDDVDEDFDFEDDFDSGRGGNGEVAVAKSSVAMSSVFAAGAPHPEQKRMPSDNSVPQLEHLAMKNSRYSLLQTGTSDFRLKSGGETE